MKCSSLTAADPINLLLLIILLEKLSIKTKETLAIGCAIAIALSPIATVIILLNAGVLTYKKGETEINFASKTKQKANDTEYSTKKLANQLIELQSDIAELKFIAQQKPEQIPQKIEAVDNSFKELIPTANQAFEDTEELIHSVEPAIAQP